MAKTLNARMAAIEAVLDRREQRRLGRMYAVAAAEMGFHPDEVDGLMADGKAFLSMPLDAQLAEVDRIEAELRAEGMTMDEADWIRETLRQEYRP